MIGSGSSYRPDIDGLRAIAVLAVVAFHAAPTALPGGFVGVDIFFVISGYLITSILLAQLAGNDFSIRHFYERRIKRLFPALLLVLAACLVAGWAALVADEYERLGKHVAAGAGFSSNLVLWGESGYFDDVASTKILLHLWSLGIEEQFYVWWPLTLWWAWKKSLPIPAVVGAMVVVSFGVSLAQGSDDPAGAFYLPFGRAWELLAGALLAYAAVRYRVETSAPWSNASSLVGATLIGLGLATIDAASLFPGWLATLPVVGTTLMIAAGPGAWLNRHVLASRTFVWFGLISYPLYLWHWPILTFARVLAGAELAPGVAAIAVVAAVLLAWGTYEFVETPVRNSSSARHDPLVLAAGMGLIGLLGWYVHANDGLPGRRAAARHSLMAGDIGHRPFFTHIASHYFPCTPSEFRESAERWQGMPRCFQSKAGVVKDVAILGDSHAEQLFVGLATKLPGQNVVFYGDPTAPLLRSARFEKVFDYVLRDRNIKVVVLSARWPVRLSGVPDEQLRLALTETVQQLTASGKKVLLATDVPTFSFGPDRCKYVGRLGQQNRCSELDRRSTANYLPIFQSVAAGHAGVTVVDAYAFFCRNESCSMTGNGVLYFRDDNHLNVAGSTTLADMFVGKIERAQP